MRSNLTSIYRNLRHRSHDILLFLLINIALIPFRVLPVSLAQSLARALAGFVHRLSDRDRTRAEVQLSDILGMSDAEAREVVARMFGAFGIGVVELLRMPRMDPDLGAVSVVGLEHLEAALARGRGVLWITGHIGNWELMAVKVARMGYRLSVVARGLRYPLLNRMLLEFRQRHGVVSLVRGQDTSFKALQQRLARGGIVGMLVDQDTRVPGTMIPFLGRPAYTPTGPALLSARFGIPIVVGIIRRSAPMKHVIRISQPIWPLSTGEMGEEELRNVLTRINSELEAAIRRDPESWPWFHQRWRTVR